MSITATFSWPVFLVRAGGGGRWLLLEFFEHWILSAQAETMGALRRVPTDRVQSSQTHRDAVQTVWLTHNRRALECLHTSGVESSRMSNAELKES